MKPPLILMLSLLMAGCSSPMDNGPHTVVLTAGWDSLATDFANITWNYGGEPQQIYVARRAGGWTDSFMADSASLRVSTTGDFWCSIAVDGEVVEYARDTTGAGLLLVGWHE